MEYKKEFKAKPGRKITTSSPRDVRRRQEAKESDTRLIAELQKQIAGLRDQFTAGTGGMTPEKVDGEIRKAVKGAIKETKDYYAPLLTESKNKEKELLGDISNLKERFNSSLEKERDTYYRKLKDAKEEAERRYNKTISGLEDRLKLAEDKIVEKDEELKAIKAEHDYTVRRLLEKHTKKLEELAKTISMEKLGVDDPDRPKMEDAFVDPLDADAGSDLESHVEIEDVSSAKKENMKGKVDKLKSLMGSFAEKEE